MNKSSLLYQVITKEIKKIERNGEKVRLKSIRKKYIKWGVILGVIALIYATVSIVPIFICAGIFAVIYFKTDRVDIIADMARKMPDTPIEDIIRGDMI